MMKKEVKFYFLTWKILYFYIHIILSMWKNNILIGKWNVNMAYIYIYISYISHILTKMLTCFPIFLLSLTNKGPYSQNYGFPSSHVKIQELDHEDEWVSKNWCFQNVVLEKTLESPLDYMTNQSILKQINPKYSFKGCCWSYSSSTLATSWEEPTHWKRLCCWKRLKAKGERGQQRMRWLDSITDLMVMNLSKLQAIVEDRGAWHAACSPWVAKNQSQLRVSLNNNTQLWVVLSLHNL